MKPELHLHIGHSKVASTSIQDFLAANIDVLRARGFLVADVEFRFPTAGQVVANPVGALEDLQARGRDGEAEMARRLQDLHGELTRRGRRFDKAILSAENLCNPGFAEAFAPALDLFDVRVVYYVRRQDDWLVSAWKQWGVKAGKSLEQFCLEGTQTRYPAFTYSLQPWERRASSTRVRPLHRSALVGGSVTRDFAHAVGLAPDGLSHPGVSNASFDAAVLDVLWRNPFLFEHRDDDRVFHFLEAFLGKEIEPMRAQLSAASRKQIQGFFEDENRELHARHFPEVDYETVFGNGPAQDAEMPGERELLYRFLALQLRGIMGLQARVDALEARLAAATRQPAKR